MKIATRALAIAVIALLLCSAVVLAQAAPDFTRFGFPQVAASQELTHPIDTGMAGWVVAAPRVAVTLPPPVTGAPLRLPVGPLELALAGLVALSIAATTLPVCRPQKR